MDIVTLAVAKKSAKNYTDSVVDGIESGFLYKGSVASIEDLPPSGNLKGDEYTLTDGSGSYAWDGSSWVPAGVKGPQGPKGDDGVSYLTVINGEVNIIFEED